MVACEDHQGPDLMRGTSERSGVLGLLSEGQGSGSLAISLGGDSVVIAKGTAKIMIRAKGQERDRVG